MEMNIDAKQRAATLDDELNKEIASLVDKLDDDDKDLLLKAQDAWRNYRDTFSDLEGNAAKGGSLRHTLYFNSITAMTSRRIQEIKECLRQDGLAAKPKRRRRPYTINKHLNR